MVIIRVGLAIRANRSTNVFPLRCSSTGNSSFTDPRNRVQVHITTLSENGQRPSMSPVTAVDNENRRTRNEIKFDNDVEVV